MCRGLRSLFLLLLIGLPLRAEAAQNCGHPGNSATMAALTLTATYDPTAAVAKVVPATLTFNAPLGQGPCILWVTFADQGNAQLTGPGGAKLSYGETDALWNLEYGVLNVSIDGNGYSAPATGTLSLAAGQKVPAGTYSQTRIVNVGPSGSTYSQSSVTISVTVASTCSLPAPSPASLDFSGGIVAGRVNAGYRQSTSISGASCTGPSRLTVRGAAMATPLSGAGFRNTIDYAATASFGSASTTLLTSSATEAGVSVPASSGLLNLDVSLVDGGSPLVAGSYRGTVSVVLEPAN